MSSRIPVCLLVLALTVLSVGCGTLPGPTAKAPDIAFTAANRPTFVVAYYPYDCCVPRHLAAPIPNYNNWTNGRMVRDLRRFKEIGFTTVLVSISADQINEEFAVERVLQFIGEADRLGGPKVVLLIGSGQTPLRRDVLARRLLTARIQVSKQALQEDGRPLVYLRPEVDVIGESHPALMFQTMPKGEWYWAVAGTVSGQELRRDGGDMLRHSIWQGYLEHRPNLVITWNDFATGNFVEPNSYDESLASDIVLAEIRRVQNAVEAAGNAPSLAD